MKTLWWLSFATEDEFLGAAVVKERTPARAVALTHRIGINPGGEVMVIDLQRPVTDAGCAEHVDVPDKYKNRLLTKTEAAEIDRWMEWHIGWERP